MAKAVKNLVQALEKIADPNMKNTRETQIQNFMDKVNDLNLVFLMMVWPISTNEISMAVYFEGHAGYGNNEIIKHFDHQFGKGWIP